MNIFGQLPPPCPLLISLYCTLIFSLFLFFLPEDGGSRFFQNVGMLMSDSNLLWFRNCKGKTNLKSYLIDGNVWVPYQEGEGVLLDVDAVHVCVHNFTNAFLLVLYISQLFVIIYGRQKHS